MERHLFIFPLFLMLFAGCTSQPPQSGNGEFPSLEDFHKCPMVPGRSDCDDDAVVPLPPPNEPHQLACFFLNYEPFDQTLVWDTVAKRMLLEFESEALPLRAEAIAAVRNSDGRVDLVAYRTWGGQGAVEIPFDPETFESLRILVVMPEIKSNISKLQEVNVSVLWGYDQNRTEDVEAVMQAQVSEETYYFHEYTLNILGERVSYQAYALPLAEGEAIVLYDQVLLTTIRRDNIADDCFVLAGLPAPVITPSTPP